MVFGICFLMKSLFAATTQAALKSFGNCLKFARVASSALYKLISALKFMYTERNIYARTLLLYHNLIKNKSGNLKKTDSFLLFVAFNKNTVENYTYLAKGGQPQSVFMYIYV